MLYENEQFKDRQLAALVASKVYYHLGSLDNALQYALGADKLFDLDENTEYVETILGRTCSCFFCINLNFYFKVKCIDTYTKIQVENFQAADQSALLPMDPRLEAIVNRMFTRFFEEKKFKQAIGIAIETRRLDMFEKAIMTSVSYINNKKVFF